MVQHGLRIVNNCSNTNIYSYLETSVGQSSNLYLNVAHISSLLIRHLWQLKTVVFLHWCLVLACLNINIYSQLETSGGQSSHLYLNVVHFSSSVLIRHLWHLKTVVFLHWCLVLAVLFITRQDGWYSQNILMLSMLRHLLVLRSS